MTLEVFELTLSNIFSSAYFSFILTESEYAFKLNNSKINSIKVGEEFIFQNLQINVLKCQNSKFDDDPEVTAYMQVKDLKSANKNKVFVFNGWTFASSPSIRPFDHPVYDIWLKKCYS